MRVTTSSVRGRNAVMIRLFALQAVHGFADDLIAEVYGVGRSAVEGWREGVLPRNNEGNLRAGLELIEETCRSRAATPARSSVAVAP